MCFLLDNTYTKGIVNYLKNKIGGAECRIRAKEKRKTALKNAVKQIKDKQYIANAKKRGYNNITAFGLVIEKKQVWIKKVNNTIIPKKD